MAGGKSDIGAALESLVGARPDLWSLSACGVTRSRSSIPALLDRDAYAHGSERVRALLVSGLSGERRDVETSLLVLEDFAHRGDLLAERVGLTAVPGSESGTGYPPEGGFFHDPEHPERRYLWRWVCFQAPDLVVQLRSGEGAVWEVNEAAAHLAPALDAGRLDSPDSLVAALGTGRPSGLAPVQGVRLTANPERAIAEMDRLWAAVLRSSGSWASPARVELGRRRARSPLEIGRVLASVYGHTLDPVVYTQGVAMSGRLRLAALEASVPSPAQDIARVVSSYASSPDSAFGDVPQTAGLAGVLWGDELTDATRDARFADLVVGAADLYRPRGPGQAPMPADVDFRVEDMFFAATILGRAYGITGDRSYADLLAEFLIDTGTQQPDGLFWHCLSAPYYWGRGNGFAALGLAEALTYLPDEHPHRAAIVSSFRRQMDALRALQEHSGMYSQVLDFRGSYQEFTATCMIGYAMARGLRLGWLDSSFRSIVDVAWQGVSERIGDHGEVVDACAGTGVQAGLHDYLDRPAISGVDDRSGGMALWFAVEMERLHRSA